VATSQLQRVARIADYLVIPDLSVPFRLAGRR